jgi:hypothetical protein
MNNMRCGGVTAPGRNAVIELLIFFDSWTLEHLPLGFGLRYCFVL